MNIHENWIRWEPINNLARKYYGVSIKKEVGRQLKIVLSDAKNEKKNVLISFSAGIIAYRRTDETYTMDTIEWLDKTYSTHFYGDWTFFKIENSGYLKWLSGKSSGIADNLNLTHFCILAVDVLIDIVALNEPIVTFLD